MIMHGPYPGYLRDPIPPLDSAAPNTFLPFAADLLNRHTRHTRHERRHTLGLWSTPRCDPGSAAWFSAARVLGHCAEKSDVASAKQTEDKRCADIDVSKLVPVQIYIVS